MGKCQRCNGTGKHPKTREKCTACTAEPKASKRKKKQSRGGGRAKKKRRTAPEDISSTTEGSPASPSSSSSEKDKPSSSPELSKSQKRKRKRAAAQKHPRPPTNGVEKPAPAKPDAHAHEHADADSDEDATVIARVEEDSEAQPADTHAAQAHPRTKDVDAAFESWYLRAVTGLFGNDLDRLRTEAQDFKAHPTEAVALLSRALKQGVELFSAAEKRVALGGVEAMGGVRGTG